MYTKANVQDLPSVPSVFEEVVAQYPNETAIIFDKETLTYSALHGRSNHLANHLMEQGVSRGDFVAIHMERSIDMMVSMLAILKCGAAYLPLDISNSVATNETFLERTSSKVVLTDDKSLAFENSVYTVIHHKEADLFSAESATLNGTETREFAPKDTAYVMFTSGSTGEPKGVVVPHQAIVRLVKNTNYIDVKTDDAILQFSPTSFDASTFEIWGALLNGGKLVLFPSSIFDPNLFKRQIADNQVTTLFLTSSLFHLIVDNFIDALRPIKTLLAGGDIMSPTCIRKLVLEIPTLTYLAVYGPTENTTFTSFHKITKDNLPDEFVPIGKAITGTEIYVVKDDLTPCGVGEEGELVCGGLGVALGYLGEPAEKRGAFFQSDLGPGLLYKTGDVVRADAEGVLEFIGRKDTQVKVRGFRISLDETRGRIASIEGVSEVAVFAHKSKASSDQLLVAYVKVTEDSPLTVRKLKDQLAEIVPHYMIPDRIVIDPNLPVTKNGKLDKKKIKLLLT